MKDPVFSRFGRGAGSSGSFRGGFNPRRGGNKFSTDVDPGSTDPDYFDFLILMKQKSMENLNKSLKYGNNLLNLQITVLRCFVLVKILSFFFQYLLLQIA